MRIGTSHGTYAYAGEMEAIYARMRAHGYTAADHNLCDTSEPWYSDMAELDRYCDRVRKAAEANDMCAFPRSTVPGRRTIPRRRTACRFGNGCAAPYMRAAEWAAVIW